VTSVTVPINTDPFPFLWQVEVAGYQWVRGYDSEWRLAARVSGTQERRLRVYAPLKDNRLFLRFAALTTGRSDIKKFADRFGVLFNIYGLADMVRRPSGQYSTSQQQGTTFSRWKWEIEKMRCLARIWKAVKGGRKSELRKVVHWKDKNAVGYRLGKRSVWLAAPELNQHLLRRFKPNDVLRPAMYLLQREINSRIADETSSTHLAIVPRLVWCPGSRIDDFARPDHHQRMIFQPTNLLAAMWLQFALAVTEEYQLRVCEGCGEPIQVGKGARRMHTQTCGSRCRQRVSRNRRRTSQKLLR